ncbi:MAG: efflux RND transporter periplasmic adaptor subunit, partial [Steroidobacteraceae bacterium]
MVTVAALLGAMAGYGWGQYKQAHPEKRGIAAQTASSSAVEADRKVLYWHDPMKPDVKFDKPGKSPFMDMQLVPVYANDTPSEGGIKISAAAQQNFGIRLGRVQRKVMVKDLTAVGTVAYDENDAVVVQARVAGYTSRLRVKAALNRVRRGQVLAEIVAPEWIEAEGEYLALLNAPSAGAAALRDAARAR